MINSQYGTVGTDGEIVVFDDKTGDIEVVSDGTDDLYIAVNPPAGFVMAPEEPGTEWIPAGCYSRVVSTKQASSVVVHLMTASGDVRYSLAPEKGQFA